MIEREFEKSGVYTTVVLLRHYTNLLAMVDMVVTIRGMGNRVLRHSHGRLNPDTEYYATGTLIDPCYRDDSTILGRSLISLYLSSCYFKLQM